MSPAHEATGDDQPGERSPWLIGRGLTLVASEIASLLSQLREEPCASDILVTVERTPSGSTVWEIRTPSMYVRVTTSKDSYPTSQRRSETNQGEYQPRLPGVDG